MTHKFSIAGHEGYITVGMYPDGTPGEIFLTMSKEGSTISGLMDSFRNRHFARPAIRRSAANAGGQVRPCALRAVRRHQQPGHSLRQVHHGLYLPVARLQVPQPCPGTHAAHAVQRARRGDCMALAADAPPLTLTAAPAVETPLAGAIAVLANGNTRRSRIRPTRPSVRNAAPHGA